MLIVAACHRVRGWNPLTQRWVLVSVRHEICWRVVSVDERTPVLKLYTVRMNFSQWAQVSSHDQRGSLGRAAGRCRSATRWPGWRPVRDERRPYEGPQPADDDPARDVTEVLTSFRAHLYGRRPARDRAEKALRGACWDTGPARPAAAVAGGRDPERAERGPGS